MFSLFNAFLQKGLAFISFKTDSQTLIMILKAVHAVLCQSSSKQMQDCCLSATSQHSSPFLLLFGWLGIYSECAGILEKYQHPTSAGSATHPSLFK